ncbi:hypothetical protein OUZ56_027937 [Daphnia magna]|uniref:Uncharacterized protein n=1 Tax=Daphnia magna TaxID=35525 RepID=A0ABR0B2D6_9CRUS|nr:hypothetical protein OUZ56_027937 [Daphnia magna]
MFLVIFGAPQQASKITTEQCVVAVGVMLKKEKEKGRKGIPFGQRYEGRETEPGSDKKLQTPGIELQKLKNSQTGLIQMKVLRSGRQWDLYEMLNLLPGYR